MFALASGNSEFRPISRFCAPSVRRNHQARGTEPATQSCARVHQHRASMGLAIARRCRKQPISGMYRHPPVGGRRPTPCYWAMRLGPPSPSRDPRVMVVSRNRRMRPPRVSGPFNSHSHTTITRHPSRRSSETCRRSRTALLSSFRLQKTRLVAGMLRPFGHECRCQKHPWTKMTALSRGKTRSGVPGKSRRCSRKR